jgi:glyoxylase-like metal-dependent hydrolase (beta-lactamase superfamily II)/rhodanese-related sulfurtransferase
MYIEQLYTGCLSEAAYYIESEGQAAIVDPLRETGPYLNLAKQRGATIKFVFETHFHADFVSGHVDLASITGAEIVYGPQANPAYRATIAQDGQIFNLGKVQIKVLHTPGHTMESSCFLLLDENQKPHALFSGDTLFVGAVGRPDLAVKSANPLTPADLANLMYDSLQNKIMSLPDDVIVYPAHGAGSSCGKGIGKETFSSIGVQKATNYALQPMSREAFIEEVTRDLPPPPPYYFEDAKINMQGYDSYDSVMARNLQALSADEIVALHKVGILVLDTRHPDTFSQGFIPGSLNIGLNGQFAIWVGTLIDINQPIVVVAEAGKEEESIMRLARVGYENVKGYLKGGIQTWIHEGYGVDMVESIGPESAADLTDKGLLVLDVRNPEEFAQGHVEGAMNIPLSKLANKTDRLDPDLDFVLHCKSGYRSMIAASILKSKGVDNFVNVTGGFDALQKTRISVVSGLVKS